MSNPLYQQMGNSGGNNMIQRFMQFRKQFNGNAQDQVQQLLNSGRVSQAQYDQAVRMAQQFQKMLSGH